MDEIKKCPFCGNKGILVHSVNSDTYRVNCFNRSCVVGNTFCYANSSIEAVEKWNSRVNEV